MQKIRSILVWIAGMSGLNMVIIVHEIGHLYAARLAQLPVPLFSIGFGPALIAATVAKTTYQLALLPLGGYVIIPQDVLATAPYLTKFFVLLAGIAANFLLALAIALIFWLRGISMRRVLATITLPFKNQFVGPIGIVRLLSYSATQGITAFTAMISSLSISIGFFNLLPIPLLDGGQLAWYTMEAITGPLPATAFTTSTYLIIALMTLLFLYIAFRDIRSFKE